MSAGGATPVALSSWAILTGPQRGCARRIAMMAASRAVELVGHVMRTVRALAQSLQSTRFVVGEPLVEGLARDLHLASDLAHAVTIFDDHEHGVVALLHLADLLKHGPPPRKEVETNGQPVSRVSCCCVKDQVLFCPVSGVSKMSTINRCNTPSWWG